MIVLLFILVFFLFLSFFVFFFFFFFQAEDGIRDLTVTGVQTCALPILRLPPDAGPGYGPPLDRRRSWLEIAWEVGTSGRPRSPPGRRSRRRRRGTPSAPRPPTGTGPSAATPPPRSGPWAPVRTGSGGADGRSPRPGTPTAPT